MGFPYFGNGEVANGGHDVPCVPTGSGVSRNPNAWMTFSIVAKLGLPSTDSERYEESAMLSEVFHNKPAHADFRFAV